MENTAGDSLSHPTCIETLLEDYVRHQTPPAKSSGRFPTPRYVLPPACHCCPRTYLLLKSQLYRCGSGPAYKVIRHLADHLYCPDARSATVASQWEWVPCCPAAQSPLMLAQKSRRRPKLISKRPLLQHPLAAWELQRCNGFSHADFFCRRSYSWNNAAVLKDVLLQHLPSIAYFHRPLALLFQAALTPLHHRRPPHPGG